jgi:hypothetical protein
MQRDTKEVLAELVGKLKERLDPKKVAATRAEEKHPRGELRPNLDRLTHNRASCRLTMLDPIENSLSFFGGGM